MAFRAGERITADRLNHEIGSKAFGHVGRTAGFFTLPNIEGMFPVLDAQQLLNGMVFSGNALLIPVSGRYRITYKGYFSGGAAPWLTRIAVTLNSTVIPAGHTFAGIMQVPKIDNNDYTSTNTVTRSLTAGDALRLLVGGGGSGSGWGTDGYNGCFLEVALEEQF